VTDIDLIKQALEYLEDNQHHIADNERHAYVMLYNDFITTLKDRLAQPEQEPTPEIKYKMIVIDDLHPQGIPVEQWVNPPKEST
jgi:hypothetical protein